MEEIKLIIDGTAVRVEKGATVLQAAQSRDIYIPNLCADADLEPYGACRLCIVEIEGMDGTPTACTTPAREGMVVRTNTPKLDETRRQLLELLLSDHPNTCLSCPKNQRCELQQLAAYMGIDQQRFIKLDRPALVDESNPFFYIDRSKCILCAKCIRVCKEVQGVEALELTGKGLTAKVAPVGDKRWLESACVSCGQCLAKCPVAALVPKDFRQSTREVKTVCPYCGVGCGIYLGVRANKVVSVKGIIESPVNKGNLCVKGRFGIVELIHHPERLTAPRLRRNGKLKEITWEEALDLVARRLSKYKGNEVAVISSATATNEDNYIIQKFARVALATNNIDQVARLCHAPSETGLAHSFGSGAMTNTIGEIGDASCILAIGTNTTAAHPIIGLEVKRAVSKRAKLIVANPRQIDLCRSAAVWLRHRPGSDVALLMGMARVIVDEKLYDEPFIKARCQNFDAFKHSLKGFDLGFVQSITGVPQQQIAEAARMYATRKPATILYALGITQQSHGTDNVLAIANLAMLTGNIGKPAAGVNPLRGHNNEQGASDMGALPVSYTGYQRVDDPVVRRKFEVAWGYPLNPVPGLTLTEMNQAMLSGQIKALYLVGANLFLSEPDSRRVQEALKRLEFFVAQDVFLSETASLAEVVLPTVTFAENDGTFTNTERRVQRVRQAIKPVGDSRPDWWIICQIAKRLGFNGFDFEHPSAIMAEIASLTPSYAGITYEHLEDSGLQWPCLSRDHSGTPILYTETFEKDGGRFTPLEYKPPPELPNEDYPLILTTERSLYQFDTGTFSRKIKGLNILRGEELAEINPEDAKRFGITDGEKVEIISRRGRITARAKITDWSPPGVVAMTFHFAESPTNVLTNPAVDQVAKIPGLKISAVRLQKAR